MADLLTLVGLAVLCVGVGLWSIPGALTTGGAVMLALGVFAAHAERRRPKQAP